MKRYASLLLAMAAVCAVPAEADENLLGYTTGAETLPKGAKELYQYITLRQDKSVGQYRAVDYKTEFEYGLTHRLSGAIAAKAMSLDTSGLLIDGYLPGDRQFGPRFSGIEAGLKYNFLSPVKDGIGVGMAVEASYNWIDAHSGQDKDTLNLETKLLLQKNYLDDTLSWATNLGLEATYAKRGAIAGLPAGFDWPTDPEMEIEFTGSTGLAYRFAPNWFAGVELTYQTEFETEIGQERWSLFGGPSLHYGGRQWWATLTWYPQLKGGGEAFPGQKSGLHLIEKTEQELRFKIGYNF